RRIRAMRPDVRAENGGAIDSGRRAAGGMRTLRSELGADRRSARDRALRADMGTDHDGAVNPTRRMGRALPTELRTDRGERVRAIQLRTDRGRRLWSTNCLLRKGELLSAASRLTGDALTGDA